MKDENYNEWVRIQNQEVKEWVSKGNSFREIDKYVVEIRPCYGYNRTYFKVHGTLIWFLTDDDMSLKNLEEIIINDIPYIKSIQFVSYFYSPIII